MAQTVTLTMDKKKIIRSVDPLMMSYNVEFAEVTGGTFWREYTPGQIAGTEPFSYALDENGQPDPMQVYLPVNLYDEKLHSLVKALGPAWVRVSGTWATKTYYDFEGSTDDAVPEGYLNILTKEQWIGVLDFIRDTGTKLMISVANCPGLHSAHEPWIPTEAEKIFALSEAYGVPVDAAEFANEPNMMEMSGFPEGYTPEDYRRDQDLFFTWLDAHYPYVLKVGPSSTGRDFDIGKNGGIENLVPNTCDCAALMDGTKVPLDHFSYHCYNGISERLEPAMPCAHWKAEEAHTEEFLAVQPLGAKTYAPLRDKYVPGGQMWVSESGDAGGGGDTWASTYLDVLRTLNELGGFSEVTDGIIFHNTLCSSDYGFLKHGTFDPRPNYFAVLLWNRLMGPIVYESGEEIREGAHVYVRSRKDGKAGFACVVINNSLTEKTSVILPKEAQVYALSGENGQMRAPVMTLNGRRLVLGAGNELPDLTPEAVPAGIVTITPGGCTFFVL